MMNWVHSACYVHRPALVFNYYYPPWHESCHALKAERQAIFKNENEGMIDLASVLLLLFYQGSY